MAFRGHVVYHPRVDQPVVENHVLELCEEPEEDDVDGQNLYPREFAQLQEPGFVQNPLRGWNSDSGVKGEVG